MYVPFSATGHAKFSEGFVVEFLPASGDPWIGNFAKGLTTFSKAVLHPNSLTVIVVSAGQCYVVDPNTRKLVGTFGGWFVDALEIPARGMIVLQSPIDFSAMNRTGRGWTTRRLSVDGFRSIRVSGEKLIGEAWDLGDTWTSFEVDLASGKATGGQRSLEA
jgi:hypothetical protein